MLSPYHINLWSLCNSTEEKYPFLTTANTTVSIRGIIPASAITSDLYLHEIGRWEEHRSYQVDSGKFAGFLGFLSSTILLS